MPVQQISVTSAGRETAGNGKSASRSKDKNEGGKAPGKSGRRSSNVSKGPPEAKEEDTSVKVGPSAQTTQKRQVKRRHRRKRTGSVPADAANTDPTTATATKQDRTDRRSPDPSPPGSEKRVEKRARTPGPRRGERERPPRLRDVDTESSSEDGGEARREARSWSKEKARRGGRRRSEEGGGRNERAMEEEVMMDEVMELQSVCSEEGKGEEEEEEEEEEEKENRAPPENGEEEGGLKKRRSASSGGSSSVKGGRGSGSQRSGSQRSGSQRAAAEERESLHGADGEREQRFEGSSSSSSPAEDGEELITKRYQETGAGGEDMSVPTPQNDVHFGENGGTAFPCSDDSEVEVCKICHCEGDEDFPLITPCHCTGSLRFVHQACLNQWIKSSDTRCCELCQYDFVMDTQLKPLSKWEKLQMSTTERRKIYCSVLFHLIAIGCVLWSIYVLVRRTADEFRTGRTEDWYRFSLANYKYQKQGVLDWPFWTKLTLVAIGFTGGLIFMYIQCKVYLQLWRRLKAFNRIITVQNCPPRVSTLANGKPHHDAVEVLLTPVPVPSVPVPDTDSEVEAAVAPAQTPV